MVNFFDKLEDRMRGWLSHHPILYGVIGGVGVVLFWRGLWLIADEVFGEISQCAAGSCASISQLNAAWWDGPLSFLIGFIILLMTGVFVSNFIGNEIIITGLRGEKKFSEKVSQEERMELSTIAEIKEEIIRISVQLSELEEERKKKSK